MGKKILLKVYSYSLQLVLFVVVTSLLELVKTNLRLTQLVNMVNIEMTKTKSI